MTGEADGLPAAYSIGGLAVPDGLDQLHTLLRSAVSAHAEVPAEALMMFETAVMEIAGNVVEHGRPHGEVVWHFDLTITPDALTATLTDSGEEYDRPPSADMPDEWAESGRGLPLAQAVLHELTFRRHAGVNEWRMVRAYAPAAEPTAP